MRKLSDVTSAPHLGALGRAASLQLIVSSKRTERPFPPLAIARTLASSTSNSEHCYTERHSIDSLGRVWPPRGAWGTDRRGAGGNGHRPWRSANHADR